MTADATSATEPRVEEDAERLAEARAFYAVHRDNPTRSTALLGVALAALDSRDAALREARELGRTAAEIVERQAKDIAGLREECDRLRTMLIEEKP